MSSPIFPGFLILHHHQAEVTRNLESFRRLCDLRSARAQGQGRWRDISSASAGRKAYLQDDMVYGLRGLVTTSEMKARLDGWFRHRQICIFNRCIEFAKILAEDEGVDTILRFCLCEARYVVFSPPGISISRSLTCIISVILFQLEPKRHYDGLSNL